MFGNHHADMQSVARGGDLYIRYPDGTLKNLTAAANCCSAGLQGANAIAVRDPAVYWDAGTKAVFSMVVGAPTQQYQVATYYWQLYEISGLALNDTPVITRRRASRPASITSARSTAPTTGSSSRRIGRATVRRTDTRSSTSTSWRRLTAACGASTRPAAICACSIRRPRAISHRRSIASAG